PPRRQGRFDPRRGRGAFGREDDTLDRWLTHGLLLLLCAGGASHLRSEEARRRASALAIERAQLAGELTTAQLASLEAQLRPHFLFNALHSVGALMRLGRSDEARTALVTLGDLLRGTLDRSREGRSTLADELELCESYLDLDRYIAFNRLAVTTTCPEEARTCEVPPLLLLPLVENAVRHGLERTTQPVEVRLRVDLADGHLQLIVENDGPPLPPEVLQAGQGQGIGLANTRKRIGTLYGARGSMTLENPPSGGARVVLGLPCSQGAHDPSS
ncbi:MAG: histidine kinase, partial [Planctomycetota bacterium]|nr:histidine kinase [Planctomycetota bacterium]